MSTDTRTPAVLFDIDGTLVDSNYLHVAAWLRAFDAEGIPVESWRVHRCIGMDGSTLMQTFAGDAAEDVLDRLKDAHSRFYKETSGLLAPLPGARELLRGVADKGLQVVLATSAPEDELAMLREVLDCDDVVAAVTSSEDVDTAKPKPDIVEIALDRAGVSAEDAVFVGDAIWDCEAANRAGVPSIGLLSGGVSRSELREAGASDVFENARDLLTKLDSTQIGDLAARVSAPR
ncbi:HAD superfamily hydrolase (TIGR01509 family) [Mycolicibacterium iranicum]|uniref:HAD superfamily hydrolase (TIGR01509 family) n=1 Tax=Mycolicibacterium iranicum TaxID=912594 RepID=A0A839Q6R6_MYCIR|nr:HAD family hydrolase [Mycolicibacterium iranicum]MBB2991659.1 HAD superfamily hydrolase (TIGR01509 family) [Mycolicibacterium iranicum]